MNKFLACLLFAILIISGSAAAQDNQLKKIYSSPYSDLSFYLNTRLNSQLDELKDPGIAVSIIHDGKVIVRNRKGVSSLDEYGPVTSSTQFYLASLSKSFTGQLMLSLKEQGMIDYETRIKNVLPELPEYMSPVSIENLLNHSSGITDYYQFITWRESEISNEYVLRLLAEKVDSLLFTPGEKFDYSNSNYIILAEIAEKVTGKSYSQLLEENIFEKYHMNDSFVYTGSENLEHAATGYRYLNNEFLINDYTRIEFRKGVIGSYNMTTRGAGGIFSTQSDLEKWLFNYWDVTDLSNLTKNAFSIEDHQYSQVRNVRYGAGWYNGTIKEESIYWHSGEFAGYRSVILFVPEYEFGVVIMSNNGRLSAEELGLNLTEKYIRLSKELN